MPSDGWARQINVAKNASATEKESILSLQVIFSLAIVVSKTLFIVSGILVP
jgi:hypothetical protein